MDRKILLIGGCVAAVSVIGYIIVKAKSNAAAAAQDSSNSQPADAGFFTGLSPISGGMSSADSGLGGGGITDPANSGSSDTGGGFDIASLLSGLFAAQASTSSLQIRTGANVSESAILAGIDLGQFGGTAAVDHTSNGTILTVNKGDPVNQLLSDIYQRDLGRAPDLAGLTFWKNQFLNKGESLSSIENSIKSSTEAQSNSSLLASYAAANTVARSAPSVETTTTSADGTSGTMSKSQA